MRRCSRREAPLAFRDLGAQLVRVDDVLVDLEERDVVVERLMQEDHELDQVRARLLPERLLAAAEEVGHQRGDAVGQRVGVEIVVQRVVAVRRVETDLDVVVAAAVALEDVADVLAEVAFHFQDQAADLARGIVRAVREELLDVRIHAGRGLARADGADDGDAGVQAALGDRRASAASARAPATVRWCCSPSTRKRSSRCSGAGYGGSGCTARARSQRATKM